jgi:hypothetical protein
VGRMIPAHTVAACAASRAWSVKCVDLFSNISPATLLQSPP